MVNRVTSSVSCKVFTGLGVVVAALTASSTGLAATYQVGPGKPYATLNAVASKLMPGDVVEVMGDKTYTGGVLLSKSGTSTQKITIRGVRVNGKRPVLSGGTNTIEMAGNYNVLEGFDLTGGTSRCLYHHGHEITVRDTVVHNCPSHGILGADSGSGSLTLETVEVYAAGMGTTRHPIYMATDESTYPGAVFRMKHCYVHDGLGGNAVKSRAERNEIYYNWIEGATYRELELIEPDGQDASLAREDSDVVGNVIRKTNTFYAVRIGSDGTDVGTKGRYRFVNNTFLVQPSGKAVIQAFGGVQTLEMHNNAFYRLSGGGVTVLDTSNVAWAAGKALITGQNNWAAQGSSVPSQFVGTLFGVDPKFTGMATYDLRPATASPLRDKGSATPASPVGYAFPLPLAAPKYVPPVKKVDLNVAGLVRVAVATIDIGAYEGAGLAATGEEEPTMEVASAEVDEEEGVQLAEDLEADEAEGDDALDMDADGQAAMACAFGGGRAGGTGVVGIGAALGALALVRRRRRG